MWGGAGFPELVVQIAVEGTTPVDPQGAGFVLGTSTLGSAMGALAWLDVTNDTVGVNTSPAVAGPADAAGPATFTLTLDNTSGLYDPITGTISSGGGGLAPSVSLAPAVTLAPSSGSTSVGQSTPYPLDIGQHVRVRASWAGTVHPVVYGYIDDIAPDYGHEPTVTLSCSDGLSVLGRAKLRAVAPVGAGDTTGARLVRVLDEAMWPTSMRSLDTGLATCQADTFDDYALTVAAKAVETEYGELWISRSGQVTFFDRMRIYLATRSLTVQATFSDTGADIDMEGLAAGKRRADLYNSATVTRDGGVEQTYADAASVAKRGVHSYSGSAGTLLESDQAAAQLARFIVAKFKDPQTRFTDIAVDATVQGMWTSLLPLRRFDRIRGVRNYGPKTIDVQLLIDGIAHSITPTSWQMTFSTRTTSAYEPFRLGISRLGTGQL